MNTTTTVRVSNWTLALAQAAEEDKFNREQAAVALHRPLIADGKTKNGAINERQG